MTTRPPSALDRACDAYVHTLAAQSPTAATAMGIAGFDAKLEDFTPEYFATVAAQARELLAEVDALEATGEFDAIDIVTARVLRDRLGVQLALSERGEDLRALNNIDSPLQRIRDTFFLMATDSEEALAAIRSRLGAVAQALEGHCTSLAAAASHGRVAPQRQVDAVIAQAEELAGADSAFHSLPLPQDTPELVAARAAAADYARWLREELRPQHAGRCRPRMSSTRMSS